MGGTLQTIKILCYREKVENGTGGVGFKLEFGREREGGGEEVLNVHTYTGSPMKHENWENS